MDKQYVSVLSEKERAALRARRKKRRKRRQRRRRQRLFRCLVPLAVVVVVCLFVALGKGSNEQPSNQQQTDQQQSSQQSTGASSESTELVPLMEIARVEPPEDPDPVPETDIVKPELWQDKELVALLAVRIGSTRLIDNAVLL